MIIGENLIKAATYHSRWDCSRVWKKGVYSNITKCRTES